MTAQRASEKIALVTGGADGLGTHLVWALARLRYGVVLASPRPDPAAGELVDRIADKGGYSRSMRADIADKVDVAALYASIDQQEGRLDLVVHHLGAGRSTNLRHITPEDWDEALGENLSGVFYSSYHARTLLEEARGQIVNIWNPGALGATGRGAARQVCRDGLVALTASMAEASAPTLPSSSILMQDRR